MDFLSFKRLTCFLCFANSSSWLNPHIWTCKTWLNCEFGFVSKASLQNGHLFKTNVYCNLDSIEMGEKIFFVILFLNAFRTCQSQYYSINLTSNNQMYLINTLLPKITAKIVIIKTISFVLLFLLSRATRIMNNIEKVRINQIIVKIAYKNKVFFSTKKLNLFGWIFFFKNKIITGFL